MNKTYPLNTPMVDWTLDVKKDHFHPQEEYEEIFSPKVPYLSTIDTLMYLAKLHLNL